MRNMVTGLLALALLSSAPASAQLKGVKITPLQRAPLSGNDALEAVTGNAEFETGGTTGRHSHPGDEYATVIEGAVEVRIDGQPPRRYGPGEAYHNPRGVLHETVNTSEGKTRVVGTFIVDKGKPLVQPAPPK